MIEPITISIIATSVIFSPILLPYGAYKTYRFFKHRKTAKADALIRHRDAHILDNEGDIEEYLDHVKDYRRIDEEPSYIDSRVEVSTGKIPAVDVVLDEGDCKAVVISQYRCPYEQDHEDGIGGCIHCTPMPPRYNEFTNCIDELSAELIQPVDLKTPVEQTIRHSQVLSLYMYDLIKAKFLEMEDTSANRRVAKDYLNNWFEKQKRNCKNIRNCDFYLNAPLAIEMFFVPNNIECIAASVANGDEILRRRFLQSNPPRIQRIIFHISSHLWAHWYLRPSGRSHQ